MSSLSKSSRRASYCLFLGLLAAACGSDSNPVATGGATRDGGVGIAMPVGDAGPAFVAPDAGAVSPGVITGGTKPDEPLRIDGCAADNAAGLDAASVAQLAAGGAGAAPRVLYPYDGTVFPRGLSAPAVMWDDAGARAVRVHISAPLFDYSGCLPVQGGRAQLPQAAWDAAGSKTRIGDTFTMEVSTLSAGGASQKATQRFTIARATLKGSIYYSSYNSQLGGIGGVLPGIGGGLPGIGGIGGSGAVLRLRPGHTAELFARTGACTGCHSVSANGQRLVASEIGGFGGGVGGVGTAGNGQIYAIGPTTGPNPAPARAGAGVAFAALTPDGKMYLSSGSSAGFGPLLNGGFAPPQASAQLYQTDTGATVASGIPQSAMMPSFSADGKLLAFTNYSADGGRTLFIMDFDPATGTAGNARGVYTTQSGYVAWPFVLPDNRGVVFVVTDSTQFSGEAAFITPGKTQGPRSDLMFVDLQTKRAGMLAQAMGYRTPADAQSEATYLPFGREELHQVYYPTASPVAAGGFFWVLFDTVRHVGSQGLQRQLWGTALRIPSSGEFTDYLEDPSAPAFYLEGQELPVANHRAFTALDPCRADGQSCESGIDCCSGFCTNGVCGVPAPRCSAEGEACKADSDCCDSALACIGGYCSALLR